MFCVLRKSWHWPQHACWSARLVLIMSLLLAAGGVPAQSALATPFQRGDVFLAGTGSSYGSGSVEEFSPSGQLRQAISGTSAATTLCFDPSGRHLILPGVGLFDSSGNLQPSKWASVTGGVATRCVADGFGDVYVGGLPTGSGSTETWPITKYDLKGNSIRTFTVTSDGGQGPLAIDLAPDQCTMYWDLFNNLLGIGRLNVCTNTQEAPFTSFSLFNFDDLRVLPDWRVIATLDCGGTLFDASGQGGSAFPSNYSAAPCPGLRAMSLDPDNTSVWMSSPFKSALTFTNGVWRFDINSGQLLSGWAASGSIAVFSPPLLGDANVQSAVDSDTAGTAEAFTTPAGYSGQMSRLHLYVDSSSTASQVVVGIYSNKNGHPGARQGQATITNLRAGSWNYIDVPSPPMSVTAGQRYWIAVLGPIGAGTIRFRDAASGPGSETSSQHNLTALPATWSTGKAWATGNLSAYGS
jgi:hypothetical protein